jgi:hypothetical protein
MLVMVPMVPGLHWHDVRAVAPGASVLVPLGQSRQVASDD